jgi:superfamily II DNA or RNA helicase
VSDAAPIRWQAGARVAVRGQLWTIVERTAFTDCDALHLTGAGPGNRELTRTILLPFDRPRLIPSNETVRTVPPRRWLRHFYTSAIEASPFGALSAAAACNISFLPYQLEPALAMLRDGHSRILIADAVGLGKTIQAGLILNQLSAESAGFRALIVAPAGLREQWAGELASRFELTSVIATSSWLARTAGHLPADVNPWSLPGIYIASFDFLKRPEAMRPLDDDESGWDLVIVDEAHAATPGSARLAAVHGVASRARRVVLLSATPHGGDAAQFRALCAIGSIEPARQPLMIFRRSRGETGGASRRRTVLLPVRLSAAELQMHRALDAYTSCIWTEARRHGNPQGRLAAIVLAKRALSSAASLAVSCRRRLQLLSDGAVPTREQQLQLPLDEEDPLPDEDPLWLLGAPGLTDRVQEERWLTAIAEAGEAAAYDESKLRVLGRLLRRTSEPAIVFTEYRDTLERVFRVLSGSGRRLTVLHGGMSPQERSTAQREFNSAGTVMLATDAAAEGLNLHHRCRLVIHFELPWSPSRLEQRTGRVDRIGQARVVHEILLVARDTAERLILAPLARRAARARTALPGDSAFFDALSESRVAAAIMEGVPIQPLSPDLPLQNATAPSHLQLEAREEAKRLAFTRTLVGRSNRFPFRAGISATLLRNSHARLPPGITSVYTLALTGFDGNVHHTELVAVHQHWPVPASTRSCADVRAVLDAFRKSRTGATEAFLDAQMAARVGALRARYATAIRAALERERDVAAAARSTAQQLVQSGLFDSRTHASPAPRLRPHLLEDPQQREGRFSAAIELTDSLSLSAIMVIASRRCP